MCPVRELDTRWWRSRRRWQEHELLGRQSKTVASGMGRRRRWIARLRGIVSRRRHAIRGMDARSAGSEGASEVDVLSDCEGYGAPIVRVVGRQWQDVAA